MKIFITFVGLFMLWSTSLNSGTTYKIWVPPISDKQATIMSPLQMTTNGKTTVVQMVNSEELELEQNATHGEIEKKLSIMGANLLIESLKNIEEGNSKFVDQVHSEATYAKKIDKGETKINWNLDAHKVLAHIHGLSPSPGAWFEYENERFKVLRARISTTNGKSSSVLDENLTVGCKSDSIQILELQRQGKNKQAAKEFLLGKKITKGSIFN